MYFRDASKCFSFFIFWIELLFFSEFGRAFEGKDDIRIFEETKVSRLLSFFISLYGNCHQELLLLITSFMYSLLTLDGGKCVVRPFVFVLPFFCVLRFSIVWGRLAGLIKAIHTEGDTHVQFYMFLIYFYICRCFGDLTSGSNWSLFDQVNKQTTQISQQLMLCTAPV